MKGDAQNPGATPLDGRAVRAGNVGTADVDGGMTAAPTSSPVGAARTRPVLFVVLAYAISWAWVIPLAVLGLTVVDEPGLADPLPGLLGPMLAALLCAALAGRAALRGLVGRMLRWRIGWRWWLAAVTPVLALLVLVGVLALGGAPLPAASGFGRFSGIPAGWGVLGVAAVIVVVDGMGEETGWRGYLQPALQRRLGPLAAAGIVAAVWAGWHAPQFFLIDSYKSFAVATLPIFFSASPVVRSC